MSTLRFTVQPWEQGLAHRVDVRERLDPTAPQEVVTADGVSVKLLDEHPALARLRAIEALPPGASVKLR